MTNNPLPVLMRMPSHYPTLACVLCCLLLFVVGCNDTSTSKTDESGAVSAATIDVATLVSPLEANDDDALYETLLRMRLSLQEDIEEAMAVLHKTSDTIEKWREDFMTHLKGGRITPEILDLFADCKAKKIAIPPDLASAYSCWLTLTSHEVEQWLIIEWIDKQQVDRVLENLDSEIQDIERHQRSGKFFSPERLAERQDKIDILHAQSRVNNWTTATSDGDKILLEQKIFEKQKRDSTY